MLERRAKCNNRRAVFAFRIATRSGKTIYVHDFRKTAPREDRCPSLKVSLEDFVLCPRVPLKRPNGFSWGGHSECLACGSLYRFLDRR